jgi:hypothetical protein
MIDTPTWTSLNVADLDDDLADAEDILGALAEPAVNDDSSLAEEMAATDYALPSAVRPVLSLVPRSNQVEAMTAWLQHRGRGVVVLPTGAGKTVVALMAIARLALRTLIVVLTIELLAQWQRAVCEQLGLPGNAVGIVGSGRREVRDLTITTFDSAAIPRRRLDGFGLLIVDEVHHVPAAQYRRIVSKAMAPLSPGTLGHPMGNGGCGRAGYPDPATVGPVSRMAPALVARATGSLAESDLARRLDCAEEEVSVRLTPATHAIS